MMINEKLRFILQTEVVETSQALCQRLSMLVVKVITEIVNICFTGK